jgi:hypothetical protein
MKDWVALIGVLKFRLFPAAENVWIRHASWDPILSRCFPTFASWGLAFLRPFPTNCELVRLQQSFPTFAVHRVMAHMHN